MSVANVPDVQIVIDSDTIVRVKATAFYNGSPAAANVLLLQANTVKGANASITPCILDIENIQFNTGTANGQLRLEWVSANATAGNQAVTNFGHAAYGEMDGFIPNNAVQPTGDVGLFLNSMQANDAWSLVVTFRKRVDGSGSFANLFSGWNPPGPNGGNSYGR